MHATYDLFGTTADQNDVSKRNKPAAPKLRAAVQLDRRSIWGHGGYLATLEDDEAISIFGTESFTENATIERLEEALFMKPVIKNGKWVEDGTFFAYKLTKPVVGPRQFGVRGSLLRDATQYLVQASALKLLDEIYDDTGSWLPSWAYWLFCYRLRKAGDTEDPYVLLQTFTAVMTQHDFLDASRKGESLRRVTKRLNAQQKRAAARAALASGEVEHHDEVLELKTA